MKRYLMLIPCVLLCGCARWLVPVTEVKGTLLKQPFSFTSPKNYESTNIVIEAESVSRGVTNRAKMTIGSIRAVMDPQIVQMSGDTFIQGMTIVRDTALEAAAKGAK
jgi:hypothetical protein